MILEIDETERIELRRALSERLEELDKIRKKAEDKGLLGAVIDIRNHVQIILGSPDGTEPGLMDKLKDPREGAQKSIFDADDQDIDREVEDGLLDGVEEEAEARLAELRHREMWSAFVGALPEPLEVDGSQLASEEVTDDDLIEHIAGAWETQSAEHNGEPEPGLYLHTTLANETIACRVIAGEAPAFFYDVVVEHAPEGDAIEGAQLLDWARRAYWPALYRDDTAAEADAELQAEEAATETPEATEPADDFDAELDAALEAEPPVAVGADDDSEDLF